MLPQFQVPFYWLLCDVERKIDVYELEEDPGGDLAKNRLRWARRRRHLCDAAAFQIASGHLRRQCHICSGHLAITITRAAFHKGLAGFRNVARYHS
ncbi:hypothetical protein WJX72_009512 [[Myrmecia] bisecta]|uniref:DNA polymerase-epsilon zinc finger domain-containing protein n=1 Tax=[Myrmecia] bisecta TaxID=41462 RepID=A0AAW1QSD6_9CHLO